MEPKLLTVSEAAQIKGVSRSAIYLAIAENRLPHRKMLGRLALREDQVLAWTPAPRRGRRKGTRLSVEAKARISQANKQHWTKRKEQSQKEQDQSERND